MKQKKPFFLVSKELSLRLKKNKIAKNVSDITFKDFCDKKKHISCSPSVAPNEE